MVRTQIQLTAEQAKIIKKIAASRGVPMAQVIRDAVDGAIRSGGGIVGGERRLRAVAIVGKFRSGKKDVSRRHNVYLAEAWNQ